MIAIRRSDLAGERGRCQRKQSIGRIESCHAPKRSRRYDLVEFILFLLRIAWTILRRQREAARIVPDCGRVGQVRRRRKLLENLVPLAEASLSEISRGRYA